MKFENRSSKPGCGQSRWVLWGWLCLLIASPTVADDALDLGALEAASRTRAPAPATDALAAARQAQVDEAIRYMQQKEAQLWELDRKYPNEGWSDQALALSARLDSLRKMTLAQSDCDDPDVRGHVQWGGKIYLTERAFWNENEVGVGDRSFRSDAARQVALERTRNLRGSRVMDLALILLHEERHARWSKAMRVLSHYGGEKEAYADEYRFFRIFTTFDTGFKTASEQEGVLRDHMPRYGLQAGSELDRELKLPVRLDRLGQPEKPAAAATTATLDFRQELRTSGSIGRAYVPAIPQGTPENVAARVTITVPAAGKLFLKIEFASDQSTGPRFYGDEMGYRAPASARILYNNGKSERLRFDNGYDRNFNARTTTLDLDAPQTVTVIISPQGATAYSAETWASDGKGYIYFPGRWQLYANFAGK